MRYARLIFVIFIYGSMMIIWAGVFLWITRSLKEGAYRIPSIVLFFIFFIIILIVYFIAWKISFYELRRLLRKREPIQLIEIYKKVQNKISPEVFNKVWLKVGEVFDIDPRLVKPSDTLTMLSAPGSKKLDQGKKTLLKWINKECLSDQAQFKTVLDLAKWVQANQHAKK